MKVDWAKGRTTYSATLSALNKLRRTIGRAFGNVQTILIKPNLLVGGHTIADVPAETVEAVIDFLQQFGHFDIYVGDGTSVGHTRSAFRALGYGRLASKAQLVDLNRGPFVKKLPIRTFAGRRIIRINKLALKVDRIISVAKMKTHNHAVVTLSIKNMMGCLARADRPLMHGGHPPEEISDAQTYRRGALLLHYNLIQLARYLYPSLAIVDAMPAMEGDGPADGTPVNMGYVVAGEAAGVDAACARAMGFSLDQIPYIKWAYAQHRCPLPRLPSRRFKPHHMLDQMLVAYKDVTNLGG